MATIKEPSSDTLVQIMSLKKAGKGPFPHISISVLCPFSVSVLAKSTDAFTYF